MTTGLFIALEGGEGAGKSTLAQSLAAAARAAGREVVVTREPGGTPVAESIRDLLLSDDLADAAPWCEAMLFAAARADHVAAVIRPALAAGKVVITDRFLDSSVAYQGVSRGLGAEAVRRVSLIATQGLRPDLTVVLDLDPEVGLIRALGANRMEAEDLAFHQTVRQAFLDFAAADPQRYAVVSAAQTPADVLASVLAELRDRLGVTW